MFSRFQLLLAQVAATPYLHFVENTATTPFDVAGVKSRVSSEKNTEFRTFSRPLPDVL